ncbi:hypothetical protein [Thalassotalea maritima]|uniref:hypothetical protein n=1 Tax=Thalassotalea maritima TaxID=3242416 RepID=UPI003528929E
MKVFVSLSLCFALLACSSLPPPTYVRMEMLKFRDQTFRTMEQEHFELVSDVKQKYAYAVFTKARNEHLQYWRGMAIGVLHNNVTGKNTYLLAEMSIFSNRQQRLLLTFDDKNEVKDFMQYAVEIDEDSTLVSQVEYQFDSDSVLAYLIDEEGSLQQVNQKPSRYWRSDRLN